MEIMTKDKKHLFAGPKAVILIGNKLNEICAKAADGTARYQAGWSDERVLEYVNRNGFPEITLGHIGRLRKTLFGPLFLAGTGPRTGTGAKTRLAALEKQMADVEAYLTSKNANWKTQI